MAEIGIAWRRVQTQETTKECVYGILFGKWGRRRRTIQFIKHTCRNISMQAYLGVHRAEWDRHQLAGTITMFHDCCCMGAICGEEPSTYLVVLVESLSLTWHWMILVNCNAVTCTVFTYWTPDIMTYAVQYFIKAKDCHSTNQLSLWRTILCPSLDVIFQPASLSSSRSTSFYIFLCVVFKGVLSFHVT